MLGLNPKFEKLLSSLKETHSIEDLAKLSLKNMDDDMESKSGEKEFVNNDTLKDSKLDSNLNSNLNSKIRVAPSLLAANFLRLEEEVKSVVDGGCDLLHIDVMDGHFVPNITLGPCVIEGISSVTSVPLDLHFMVEDADFFIDLYAPLKPLFMSVHIESERHLHRIVQKIRSYNIHPAIALNPHTSIDSLKYILSDIDMVLVMSVNPGFGGQSFIESSLEKIADLKEMIDIRNKDCLIQADGGITDANITALKNAGLDIAVAGSYIFNAKDRKKAISALRI